MFEQFKKQTPQTNSTLQTSRIPTTTSPTVPVEVTTPEPAPVLIDLPSIDEKKKLKNAEKRRKYREKHKVQVVNQCSVVSSSEDVNGC